MAQLKEIFLSSAITCSACFKAAPEVICTTEECSARVACFECAKTHPHQMNLVKWKHFCNQNFSHPSENIEDQFQKSLTYAIHLTEELQRKLTKSQKHYTSWKENTI